MLVRCLPSFTGRVWPLDFLVVDSGDYLLWWSLVVVGEVPLKTGTAYNRPDLGLLEGVIELAQFLRNCLDGEWISRRR